VQLLPPTVDDLLPSDHLARFVVEVVERLDLTPILSQYEARGRGSTPYHPALLLALLFYGYASATMSSRKIERACRYDLAYRFIAGGHVPDHDTINSFRKRHLAAISELFVQILLMAREMGFLKVGTVAIDGTKVRANASKRAAVSHERAREVERRLREQVEELMRQAEAADNAPAADPLDIPAEIADRHKRIERMQEAQLAIAARHGDKAVEEYAGKMARNIEQTREALDKGGKPPEPPEPPDLQPPGSMQHNFTDPDSRIMPDAGSFGQCYNAQAAVDTTTMLVVGQHVTQQPNDKKELLPALASIDARVGTPTDVVADAGCFSAANIAACPARAWISPDRARPKPTASTTTAADRMRRRLATAEGQALYGLRKMTVEPAFGIIKSTLGFRQFLLRGIAKTRHEWALVCLAYNLKRLWRLQSAS
jgi:transposase